MQDGTTIEEAVCVMKATATVTEHIATKTFEIQRTPLSRDSTRVSLDTLLITTCPSIMHIPRDWRTTLANYNKEIVQESSKVSGTIANPSQIVAKVVKSEYIW